MKRLERGCFTVKDFIKNHRTKEHVAMLKKTLEVYKREDAKYLNKHLVGYIEFLLNEKKPTASGYADFTEEQIVNLYYNGDFREHISYIYSVFATELEFNKKYGYSNPSDEVIDFWKNTYKYFENFAKEQNDKKYWQKREISQDYVNEDIIITDLCYLRGDEDISREIDPPYDLYADTIYGDWSCSLYDKDTKNKIGDFCADAGNVIIVSLKDVLKFNPNFEKWMKEHNWCVSIVKNFTGTAYIKYDIEHYEYKGKQRKELYCYVEGIGNVNFTSKQTGF